MSKVPPGKQSGAGKPVGMTPMLVVAGIVGLVIVVAELGSDGDRAAQPAPPASPVQQIRDIAQAEVDRVNAVPPNRLVIKPPAPICETLAELSEMTEAVLEQDLDHASAVPGCVILAKGTRVAVLDYPSLIAVHIRMILPQGVARTEAGADLNGAEFYTMPASLADGATVPATDLLTRGN